MNADSQATPSPKRASVLDHGINPVETRTEEPHFVRILSDNSLLSQITLNALPKDSTSSAILAQVDIAASEEPDYNGDMQTPTLTLAAANVPNYGGIPQSTARTGTRYCVATVSIHPTSPTGTVAVGMNDSGARRCRFALPDRCMKELQEILEIDEDNSSGEDSEAEEVDSRTSLLPLPVQSTTSRSSYASTFSWKRLKQARKAGATRDRRKRGVTGHKLDGSGSIRKSFLEFWMSNWRDGTIWWWIMLLILGSGMVWVFVENEEHENIVPQRKELMFDDGGHLVRAKHGAVSSDVEACSVIGVNLMKAGGNAVDAAIGTGACIGTINSFASGIGGGGFAVVYLANGESKSFNFREMAPGKAEKNMFNASVIDAQVGGKAFAIPGEVHGYWTMHQKYGKLCWEDLWTPSINLNRDGFIVTDKLSELIKLFAPFFQNRTEEWEFVFSNSDGNAELLGKGDKMRRPALAATLEKISKGYDGVKEFYNGTIARSLASYAQKHNGIITAEDFSKFFTIVEPTVSTTVSLSAEGGNRRFYTCPPPCSGPALIEGLNVAEGLDLQDPSDPVTRHKIIEVMKWISAARTELGDPADLSVSNIRRIEELMTKAYAASIRMNISDEQTYDYKHYHPAYEPNFPKGTSHISVLDSKGNAVALTTTVNSYFGARLHDSQTGIVLNSEMDDFSIPTRPNSWDLRPSKYNYIRPYKRPLSSISPTIAVNLERKQVEMVIGASGGSKIVTSVFECIVKFFVWRIGLLETIRTARTHHQLLPQNAFLEKDLELFEMELRKKGHDTKVVNWIGSVANGVAVTWDNAEKNIWAVADWWRKRGRAAGY